MGVGFGKVSDPFAFPFFSLAYMRIAFSVEPVVLGSTAVP